MPTTLTSIGRPLTLTSIKAKQVMKIEPKYFMVSAERAVGIVVDPGSTAERWGGPLAVGSPASLSAILNNMDPVLSPNILRTYVPTSSNGSLLDTVLEGSTVNSIEVQMCSNLVVLCG